MTAADAFRTILLRKDMRCLNGHRPNPNGPCGRSNSGIGSASLKIYAKARSGRASPICCLVRRAVTSTPSPRFAVCALGRFSRSDVPALSAISALGHLEFRRARIARQDVTMPTVKVCRQASGLTSLAAVQQSRVNSYRDGFRDRIDRVSLLTPQANSDDAWLVLHQESHSFPA